MVITKMTMNEVEEFLKRNRFGYTISIAEKNVIEFIEAKAYPPSGLLARFYKEETDEDRANEIGTIKKIHKIRGKILE